MRPCTCVRRSVPAGRAWVRKGAAAALGASAAARGEDPERYDGYTSETIMLVCCTRTAPETTHNRRRLSLSRLSCVPPEAIRSWAIRIVSPVSACFRPAGARRARGLDARGCPLADQLAFNSAALRTRKRPARPGISQRQRSRQRCRIVASCSAGIRDVRSQRRSGLFSVSEALDALLGNL